MPACASGEESVVTVGGLIDVRYARTDAARSWLDGGLGKLRGGAGVAGSADLLRLSQSSLLLDAELGAVVTAHVQLNVDAEPDERLSIAGEQAFAETARFSSWRGQ